MAKKSARELPPEALHWRCDPAAFEGGSAADDHPFLMGQGRAIEALRFGLAIESPGHNVFVSGPSGTGKMSTVRSILGEKPQRPRPLFDFLYVNNFDDPDRPRLLRMPAGQGRPFRRAFQAVLNGLQELIPRSLELEHVASERRAELETFASLERALIGALREACEAIDFRLVQVDVGDAQQVDVYPVNDGEPIDLQALERLIEAGEAELPEGVDLETTRDRYRALQDRLRTTLTRLRKEARKMQEAIRTLEEEAVREALDEELDELAEDFSSEGVPAWLGQVAAAIASVLDLFGEEGKGEPETGADLERFQRRLQINLLLDNGSRIGSPVVFENFPSFSNLMGTVERPTDDTRGPVDFTHIRAGSLLRANGGFLVLSANDAFDEPGVWRALARVLKSRELEIQSPEQFLSPGSMISALKPEPIPVDVKVIVVGEEDLYRALYLASDDFRRIFKIKADFDHVMARTDENLALYADLARRVEREEQLLPVSGAALARLAEYGVRLAGRRNRLSTRFSDLTDVQREASFYAQRDGAAAIGADHVDEALRQRRQRHNLSEERVAALFEQGIVQLRTEGEEVGAINALTILDVADHVFGQACRVTATCAAGRDGVVSLDREVKLSGRFHDKGTLLMSGYLRGHYSEDAPFSLSATLAFEQLHEELDGDSASVAEALALLSAIAEIPLAQSIAITGAIDQRGRVLAVGGVNEKVEGFFQLCAARGLTGGQGVILPCDNEANLMLDVEVVQAVAAGRFHIWPVRHLDEAIERMTGRRAGARRKNGTFPRGSFNWVVRQRLIALGESECGPAAPPHPGGRGRPRRAASRRPRFVSRRRR